MGWLGRADADGGTDGEETPRRRELPDNTALDMEQWGDSNAAPPEGIVTGKSEFRYGSPHHAGALRAPF